MALFDKIRPLDLFRAGEVNTYTATATSGVEQYLLHWLPVDGTPALTRVLKMLDDLPREARSLLLELGSRDGKAYLITAQPAAFTTLEEWLQSIHGLFPRPKLDLEKKGVWRVPSAAPASPVAKSDPLPNSELPKSEQATREMIAYGLPTKPPAAPPSPSAFAISGGLKEAGEFTRLMNSAPPSAKTAPSPMLPEVAGSAPGEFTRLFAAQGHQLVSPASMPAPDPLKTKPATPASEPGEFTLLFRPEPPAAPQLASVIPVASPALPPISPSVPEMQPGEFTRLINAGAMGVTPPRSPAALPPMPPAASEPGEFTRLMSVPTPSASTAPPRVSPAPPPAFPAAPIQPSPVPQASEPGEFTRLMQSPLAHSPAARPQDVSKEYDQMFGAQAGRQPQPLTPQAPTNDAAYGATRLFNAPPAAPKVETPLGPSEYTRLMAAPRAETPSTPGIPAADAAKPAGKAVIKPKNKDQIILLAVLAVLAIVAIGVIAYFALAKQYALISPAVAVSATPVAGSETHPARIRRNCAPA